MIDIKLLQGKMAPLSLFPKILSYLKRCNEDDNFYLDPCQVLLLRSHSNAFTEVSERDVWFSTKALWMFKGRSMSSFPAKVHIHVGIVIVVVIIVVVIVIEVVVTVDII